MNATLTISEPPELADLRIPSAWVDKGLLLIVASQAVARAHARWEDRSVNTQ